MANCLKVVTALIACYLSSDLASSQETFSEIISPDSATCYLSFNYTALRNEISYELVKRYCPKFYHGISSPNRPILSTEIYGKSTGTYWDDVISSCELGIIGIKSLMICDSGFSSIISIQVTYLLTNGSTHEAPKRGGNGGICSTIELASNESFTEIEVGTDGSSVNYISLTSKNSESLQPPRTYGATKQTPHVVNGYILGFRGYSNSLIEGLGVFYLPTLSKDRQTYGGTCTGHLFDDMVDSIIPPVIAIKNISFFHVDLIHSIQTTYILLGGSLHEGHFVGNASGRLVNVSLSSDDEVLHQVNVTTDSLYPVFLGGLTFFTRLNGTSNIYGPFGGGNEAPVAISGTVLGFHGYYGFNDGLGYDNICQIGVYRVNKF